MTQTEQRTVRTALEAALVQWATEERERRGDAFATENELESIKSEPLAFADLLKGEMMRESAYDFLLRILSIIREEAEPEQPDVMPFSELPVGTLFEFYHGSWATSCGSMAHGPWIKVSPRRYKREGDDIFTQVGSVKVPVICGRDCMGRR